MKIDTRSYRAKYSLPSPHVELGDNLITVTLSWGDNTSVLSALERAREYIIASKDGAEVTSPYQIISSISPFMNHLRISLLLANDIIYREGNKNEYRAGAEIFIGAKQGQEFAWAQIGQPSLFLGRPNQGLLQLSSHLDLSWDLASSHNPMPPIPKYMAGIDRMCNPIVGSFKLQENDRLALVHRAYIPSYFYGLQNNSLNLSEISNVLTQDSSELPFWAALVNLT